MKNTHGRTCKRTKVYIYLYISLYENLFENGCMYIYIYIWVNKGLKSTYVVHSPLYKVYIYIYIYIYIGSRKKTTLSSRQACSVISHSSGDLNTDFLYIHIHIYIYIYIYTHFQKGFHTERYIDRYILLFSCTCARVYFSLVIVQLVKNSVQRQFFSSSSFLFQFDMSF